MAFPQRFLDELIDRSDIVDVVSSYVALKKQEIGRASCRERV